jgi:hypothetical protein
MRRIDVEPAGDGRYRVNVEEVPTRTSHLVTADTDVLEKLGVGHVDPERVVRESFVFLLEREPASSILREFSLDVITRYFPEYPEELPTRL